MSRWRRPDAERFDRVTSGRVGYLGSSQALSGDGLTFTACRVEREPLRSAACDLQFFPAIYARVL